MNTDINNSALRVRDHLANERTFLAWIRTSIGIMAFGFVVQKFSLFLKQIALVVGASNFGAQIHLPPQLQGFSRYIGIFLVALGVLITFLAFVNYKRTKNQINSNIYKPSDILILMVTTLVFLIGIALVFYLVSSL
jgi:putative membrane protein